MSSSIGTPSPLHPVTIKDNLDTMIAEIKALQQKSDQVIQTHQQKPNVVQKLHQAGDQPVAIILPNTGAPLKKLKSKGVVYSDADDIVYPEWIVPHRQDTASEDIAYRTGIDPNLSGQDHDRYLVIPKLGIIAPIMTPSHKSSDYTKLIDGYSHQENFYLKDGLLHYPNSVDV